MVVVFYPLDSWWRSALITSVVRDGGVERVRVCGGVRFLYTQVVEAIGQPAPFGEMHPADIRVSITISLSSCLQPILIAL